MAFFADNTSVLPVFKAVRHTLKKFRIQCKILFRYAYRSDLTVYVKTKKTDPLCINTELRSVYLVITEFNLWAFEVTLKRKKAGLLPLREKSDLITLTNAVALYGATIFSNHVTRILYLLLQTLSTSIINS